MSRGAAAVLSAAIVLGAGLYFRPRPASDGVRPADARAARPADDPAPAFRRAIASARPGAWVAPRNIPDALSPGPPGAWDDFKIGSPVVLEEHQSGTATYRLWYRGCHLSSGYVCGVGHAVSKDGLTWERSPQPVFTPPDAFEREHLDAIAVARGSAGYLLWYSVSPSWFTGHPRAALEVAHSSDGITWTAQSAVVYQAVALAVRLVPAAAWDGQRFHVWLMDDRSPLDPDTGLFPEMPAEGDQMLLHFVSVDGRQFEANGGTPIAPLEMDPATLSIAFLGLEGFRAVFYEQHPLRAEPQGVAVLRSHDGTNWERAKTEAMPLAVRDLGTTVVPVSLTMLPASGGALAWFVVRRDKGGESIHVAFRKEAV